MYKELAAKYDPEGSYKGKLEENLHLDENTKSQGNTTTTEDPKNSEGKENKNK